MPIEFDCANCATTLRVPEEHAGKMAKCPNCQSVVTVPASAGFAPVSPVKSMEGNWPNPDSGSQYPNSGANQGPGNPYQYSGIPNAASRNYGVPHRGGMVLTFGILALVCNFLAIPGIVAWVMGKGDLKQMDRGMMDAEGRGLTQAGMIMGMIGTGFVILAVMVWIAYVVFFLVFFAAAAAGAH